MKQIAHKISPEQWAPESPYVTHHAYVLHLGNRRRLHFKSKRLAAAYEADTKRWLKDLVLEGNTYLGHLMQDYRDAWPTLTDTNNQRVNTSDARIRELIQQCVRNLDRATVRGQRNSALYYAWLDVARCFHACSEAFALLESFYQYKTQGVLRWRMAMRVKQCEHALERMEQYGAQAPQVIPGQAQR